jgi:GNAT superfamily N-acetyltransferase
MIIIRKAEASDRHSIEEICYKTGYMGEDLSGLEKFNDKQLFASFFCVYYVLYECQHCFVAVDTEENKIEGYILGTPDTKAQHKKFAFAMGWRIALRILFISLWKHPESIKAIIHFAKGFDASFEDDFLYSQYPAHLHINILADYQKMGIGKRLIEAFEQHIRNLSKGLHLVTSNKNSKAIPFYNKMGYKLLKEKERKLWKGIDDYKTLIFVKEFY